MRHIILIFSLLLVFSVKTQTDIEVSLYGGGTVSYLGFNEFKEFVNSYNQQNQGELTKELKFNPIGFGGQFGSSFRMKWFYSSLSVSYSKTMNSFAEIDQQKRAFYFKNYLFDLLLGVQLGKGKLKFTPHVNMTISSLNLESYFQYENGQKSFGSDTRYSGVFTSNKMTATVGLMSTFDISDNMRLYMDFGFFPKAKKYGGGSFDYSASGTDSQSFPKSAYTVGYVGVAEAMTETYRQFFLHIGFSYSIFHTDL